MADAGRLSGRIVSWKDDRGFGFIAPSDGGEEVFVHISAFTNRSRRPGNNEAVTFQIRKDNRGRPQATRVGYVDDAPQGAPAGVPLAVMALVLAGMFLTGVVMLVLAGQLPSIFLPLYLCTSAVAFLVYAWDKSAARNNRWRTRETTLHLLGLVGGWPGALVARQVFRHKSRKQSFIVAFRCTVVLNVAVVVWLLTPSGRRFVESVFGAL